MSLLMAGLRLTRMRIIVTTIYFWSDREGGSDRVARDVERNWKISSLIRLFFSVRWPSRDQVWRHCWSIDRVFVSHFCP